MTTTFTYTKAFTHKDYQERDTTNHPTLDVFAADMLHDYEDLGAVSFVCVEREGDDYHITFTANDDDAAWIDDNCDDIKRA
jgi:hypothetical protein